MMARIKQMVDLEYDDEDSLDAVTPMPMARPLYPPGLRICLTEKELEKLGFDPAEAEVGGTIHITGAMGEITSVSCEDNEGGKRCRVEIQIQKIAIESEDAENDAPEAESAPAENRPSRRKKAPIYG